MGPRVGLDGCGKSRPHRDLIPGPSSIASHYTDYGIASDTQMKVSSFSNIYYDSKWQQWSSHLLNIYGHHVLISIRRELRFAGM